MAVLGRLTILSLGCLMATVLGSSDESCPQHGDGFGGQRPRSSGSSCPQIVLWYLSSGRLTMIVLGMVTVFAG